MEEYYYYYYEGSENQNGVSLLILLVLKFSLLHPTYFGNTLMSRGQGSITVPFVG